MAILTYIGDLIIATISFEQFVVPRSFYPGGEFGAKYIRIGTATIGVPSIIEKAKTTIIKLTNERIIIYKGKIFDIIEFLREEKFIYIGSDQKIPKSIFKKFKIIDNELYYSDEKIKTIHTCEPKNYTFNRKKYRYNLKSESITPSGKFINEDEIKKLLIENNIIEETDDIDCGYMWIDSNDANDSIIYYGYINDLMGKSKLEHNSVPAEIPKNITPIDPLVGYYHSSNILISIYASGKIIYNSSATEPPSQIFPTVENILTSFDGETIIINCSGKFRHIKITSVKFAIANSIDNGLILILHENEKTEVIRTINLYISSPIRDQIDSKIQRAVTKQNFGV